jgi:hypothetical protein
MRFKNEGTRKKPFTLMKIIETIKYSEFNRILTEEFKHKKPSEVLV